MARQYSNRLPVAERFWRHVDKSGGPDACWVWQGAMFKKGYGCFAKDYLGRKSTMISAHRMAYELTHGPIPKNVLACHRCDNPPCCNPAHIFLGTPRQNTLDALVKRRMPPSLRLTPAHVRKIRRLYVRGKVSQQSIANQFGVSQYHISRIVAGKTWKSLT